MLSMMIPLAAHLVTLNELVTSYRHLSQIDQFSLGPIRDSKRGCDGSRGGAGCYDRFSSPVGTENRGGSEVGGILTAAYREFGGCAHRCAGKPKRRDQDRASPRRRGRTRLGTAEGQLSESGNFCWVRARRWTPSCVHYMSWALLKAGGCRREHRGRA